MIWKKIALIAIAVSFLGFVRQDRRSSTLQKQEEKTKMADVAPELREKAFGLLTEVVKESENLKLPINRIALKIRAADLLWEKDPHLARKILFETRDELVATDRKATGAGCLASDSNMIFCNTIQELQRNLIEVLIERETGAAEELLKAASNPSYEMELLQRNLYKRYLSVNPQKAFEMAEEDFKKYGPTNYMGEAPESMSIFSLPALYRADPDFGSKLAREILTAIKRIKIEFQSPVSFSTSNSVSMDADRPPKKENLSGNTNSRAPTNVKSAELGNLSIKSDLGFTQVSSFLQQAENLSTERINQMPLLTQNEMSELASMFVESLIAKPQFNFYPVYDVYPELVKYAPDQIQKLRRQLLPAEIEKLDKEVEREIGARKNRRDQFHMSNSGQFEDLLKNIENAPIEKRDDLYARVSKEATTCCGNRKSTDAFSFYMKIEKKEKFPELGEMFADLIQRDKARKGDLKELRKVLSAEKDPMEKVEFLSQTAIVLAQNGDMGNSNTLTVEAQKLLPEQYKNSSQLRAYVAYIRALVWGEGNQSFSLSEIIAPQANENINTAARFYQVHGEKINIDRGETLSIKNGEFLFDVMEAQSAIYMYPSIPMIKRIAQADFERTVKLANKFTRPEVRLFARWHIAESLLNKYADENEEKNSRD